MLLGALILIILLIYSLTRVPFIGDLLETPFRVGPALPEFELMTPHATRSLALITLTAIIEARRIPLPDALDLLTTRVAPRTDLTAVTSVLTTVRLPPVLLHLSPLDKLLQEWVIPTPLVTLPCPIPRNLVSLLLRPPRFLVASTAGPVVTPHCLP